VRRDLWRTVCASGAETSVILFSKPTPPVAATAINIASWPLGGCVTIVNPLAIAKASKGAV
jgi:hypothetical protein